MKRGSVNLEQIRDDLVVDLQVGSSHHEGGVLRGLHLNESEDLLHAPRHYSSVRVPSFVLETLHGVSLSRASLAVGQDGRIVALKHREHSGAGSVVVHVFLRRRLIVYIVEGEGLPHTKVRILINVFLFFSFVNFCSQVFHNCTRVVVI